MTSPELIDLRPALDVLSNKVREAEAALNERGLTLVTARVGQLAWEPMGKRHRICLNGKPLLDCSVADRIAGLRALPELFAEINREASQIMSQLDEEIL